MTTKALLQTDFTLSKRVDSDALLVPRGEEQSHFKTVGNRSKSDKTSHSSSTSTSPNSSWSSWSGSWSSETNGEDYRATTTATNASVSDRKQHTQCSSDLSCSSAQVSTWRASDKRRPPISPRPGHKNRMGYVYGAVTNIYSLGFTL